MRLLFFLILSKALFANFTRVTYVDNYDGDTITVNIPKVHPLLGKKIKVRLNGIDTPEIRGSSPCEKKIALQAKYFVQRALSEAHKIELRNPSRGKYFRIVADVWFDGSNLGEILLAEKLAVPYDGGTKPENPWCKSKGKQKNR